MKRIVGLCVTLLLLSSRISADWGWGKQKYQQRTADDAWAQTASNWKPNKQEQTSSWGKQQHDQHDGEHKHHGGWEKFGEALAGLATIAAVAEAAKEATEPVYEEPTYTTEEVVYRPARHYYQEEEPAYTYVEKPVYREEQPRYVRYFDND